MYNKNAWKSYTKEDLDKVMSFAEGYKDFISNFFNFERIYYRLKHFALPILVG